MPRQTLPFDAHHARCVFPQFGKHFDAVMAASGKSAAEIAKAADIAAENVYGYRRGFSRPSATTHAKLEKIFGVSLDPNGAPVKPTKVSVPGTITIERDKAGQLKFSFTCASADLAKFLAS